MNLIEGCWHHHKLLEKEDKLNFVKIIFNEARDVFVDGKVLGSTNEILFLGEDGTYTFDLGVPKNYEPLEQTIQVTQTSRRNPLEIEFTKVG